MSHASSSHDDFSDEHRDSDNDNDIDADADVDADADADGDDGGCSSSDDEVEAEPEPVASSIMLCPSRFGRPHTVFFDYPAAWNMKRKQTKIPIKQTCTLRFRHCDNACIYNCVISSLKRNGFIESKTDKWNVRYGKHMSIDAFHQLKSFQKINHFPGTGGIGRKDRLARNLGRLKRFSLSRGVAPQEFDWLPETFLLPHDRTMWEHRFAAEPPGTLWISKPNSSSCGRGIKMVSKLSDIAATKSCIVSRYVARPLLINNKKFDMRIYVLCTSYDPLRIYLFENGLARFCTSDYSTKTKDLKRRYVHLTNFSVNKKSKAFDWNKDQGEDGTGSKWSLIALRRFMAQQIAQQHNSKNNENTQEDEAQKSVDGVQMVNDIWANIKDIIIKTLLSIESNVTSHLSRLSFEQCPCYELFGFDILLDADYKPWLMEVNIAPSLSASSPLDKQIKFQLLTDIFHTIGVRPAYNKKENANMKIKQSKLSKEQKLDRLSSAPSANKRSALNNGVPRFAKLQSVNNKFDGYTFTKQELNMLRDTQDELERALSGSFERIFPTTNTYERYEKYFEFERYNNLLLSKFIRAPKHIQDKILMSAKADQVFQSGDVKKTRRMSAPRTSLTTQLPSNIMQSSVEYSNTSDDRDRNDDYQLADAFSRQISIPPTVPSSSPSISSHHTFNAAVAHNTNAAVFEDNGVILQGFAPHAPQYVEEETKATSQTSPHYVDKSHSFPLHPYVAQLAQHYHDEEKMMSTPSLLRPSSKMRRRSTLEDPRSAPAQPHHYLYQPQVLHNLTGNTSSTLFSASHHASSIPPLPSPSSAPSSSFSSPLASPSSHYAPLASRTRSRPTSSNPSLHVQHDGSASDTQQQRRYYTHAQTTRMKRLGAASHSHTHAPSGASPNSAAQVLQPSVFSPFQSYVPPQFHLFHQSGIMSNSQHAPRRSGQFVGSKFSQAW